MKDRP